MSARRAAIARLCAAALAVCLALASLGCVTARDDEATTVPATVGSEEVDNAGDATIEWLSGPWSVVHALNGVTSEAHRERADLGEVVVEFMETGSGARYVSDGISYDGVTVFGDGDFRFEGAATFDGEDDSVWETDVIVTGRRFGEDSWMGDAWAQYRSADGLLAYEATWSQRASRER